MLKVISFVQSRMGRLAREESAQDGFEYLLIVGVVSVGVVTAMVATGGVTDLADLVVGYVTDAVQAAFGIA
jgi:Flp pilus assembly pilin Flp